MNSNTRKEKKRITAISMLCLESQLNVGHAHL